MNNRIIALFAVIVIAVAGVSIVAFMSNGDDNDNDAYAVSLNGVEATESNVRDNSYLIKRNLIVCTNGEATGNVAEFLNYVTSADGQKIVGKEFISIDKMTDYKDPDKDGKTMIAISGSTTIMDTMTRIAEGYMAKYPYMKVSITGGGSGQGASNTINGVSDIGMCSRDLKASEAEKGLIPTIIGKDGVAVIVNGAGVKDLTIEQIAKIYDGTYTNWSQVGGVDKSIGVVCREDGSGTRECFEESVKASTPGWKMKSDVNSLSSTGAVIKMIGNTDGSIGYISIGQLINL